MRFEIAVSHHHTHEVDSRHIEQRIDEILRSLKALPGYITSMEKAMAQFDDIEKAIARNTSVVNSAIELLASISARLVDAKDDPEEISALAAEIDANSRRLADAIAASTPVDPAKIFDTPPQPVEPLGVEPQGTGSSEIEPVAGFDESSDSDDSTDPE